MYCQRNTPHYMRNITVRMDDEDVDLLDDRADAEGVTRSDYIRDACLDLPDRRDYPRSTNSKPNETAYSANSRRRTVDTRNTPNSSSTSKRSEAWPADGRMRARLKRAKWWLSGRRQVSNRLRQTT